jgi:hypothetical protein
VPGLLYATTWADGHGEFLAPPVPRVVTAAALLAIGGLLPTGLALRGGWRAWRRRRELAGAGPAFAYAALLVAALLAQTWALPVFSAVKASYLLSALLPFALLLALGLEAARPRARALLRAALLAYAAAATCVTWWGWWREGPPPRPPAQRLAGDGDAGAPAAVVAAYFRALGRDPIRTLPLLTDAAHREHALRLATAADVARHLRGEAGAIAGAGEAGAPVPVERHQVAWLSIQKREPFRALGAQLALTPLSARVEGDRATVAVRIEPPGGVAFEQAFGLVRAGAGAPWRIDGVEQRGVTAANGPAAFVAWPNEATRAWLESAQPPPR